MALFKKDKDQKKKGQEGLIGKIIYACLLFAPIFSILVSCMYVVFNKNAKDSYSDDYLYKTYLINSQAQFNPDITYQFKGKNNVAQTGNSGNSDIYYISLSASDLNLSQADYDSIAKYQIAGRNTTGHDYTQLVLKNSNLIVLKRLNIDENLIFSARISYDGSIFSNFEITENILKSNTLDNVFEYSLKKVENSTYYNWSKQTGTYTVLETTCNGLGITNTFAPMLLAYWLIISIIYFLYDIALILIWAVHDKIHELKESI